MPSPVLPADVAAPAQALHAEHGLDLLQEDQPRVEAAGTLQGTFAGLPDFAKGRTLREWRRGAAGWEGQALPWASGQQWGAEGCESLLSGVPQESVTDLGLR